MEGDMTRAKMSDAYGRWSFACAVEAPKPYPCVENDSVLIAACEGAAEREARAILAETEPNRRFTGEPDPYAYMVADWPGFRGSMYACALAESLAAFVGA